jgi:hypothetical protein
MLHNCAFHYTLWIISRLLILNADPAFWCWHHMEVGCDANVSEEHTASIIRAEVRSAMEVDDLYRDGRWIRPQELGQSKPWDVWANRKEPCLRHHNTSHSSPDDGSSMFL